MTVFPKTFRHDHVLRDEKNRPLARAILRDDRVYEEGEPIEVAILTVPVAKMKKVRGRTFWVDGVPYRIPDDLSPLKLKEVAGKHMINNFHLRPVSTDV